MTKQIIKLEGLKPVLVITHPGQAPLLYARGASNKWGGGNVTPAQRTAVLAHLAS